MLPLASVAMNELIWKRTTAMPLTSPTTTADSSAMRIAGHTDQPCWSTSPTVMICDQVKTDATERSNSPTISGSVAAKAMKTMTTWLEAMLLKLVQVPNVSGRAIEKTMISRT